MQIVRATQFHEFVGQLVDWGRQGDVSYVPRIRTQLIAARAVAEVVVDVATGRRAAEPMVEVAGPRVERLVEVANALAARRGDPERVEEASDPADPNRELFETDGLLPGPDAIITGPTFGNGSGRRRRPRPPPERGTGAGAERRRPFMVTERCASASRCCRSSRWTS